MIFSHQRQIGFAAQDIEKIYPEIVQTDPNGYKSVDYGRLTPVLVEAMKEQQFEIDSLSKQNEKLEDKIMNLQSEMEELKKKLEILIEDKL